MFTFHELESIYFLLFGQRIFISPFHCICKHKDGKHKVEQKTKTSLVLKLLLEKDDEIELQATENNIQHHFSLLLRRIHHTKC